MEKLKQYGMDIGFVEVVILTIYFALFAMRLMYLTMSGIFGKQTGLIALDCKETFARTAVQEWMVNDGRFN